MKYRKCEICGLRSARKDGTKRYFMARFPLDEVRCKKWVKMTGNEDLVYLPIEKLHNLKFVCGNHFKNKDFKTKKTQLKNTAVPSIRLTAEPLSDEKLIEFPYHILRESKEATKEDVPSTSSALTASLGIAEHTLNDKENLLVNFENIYNECDLPSVDNIMEVCTTQHPIPEDSRREKEDVPSTSSARTASLGIAEHTLNDNENLLVNFENIYNECDLPSVDNIMEVCTTQHPIPEDNRREKEGVLHSLAVPKNRRSSKDIINENVLKYKNTKALKVVKKQRTKKNNTGSCSLQLSPTKKKLVKRLKNYKLKLKTFKEKVKMFDNINSKALKMMLLSAYKNQNRCAQGKRWTENDKSLAIAMYKKSPKLYRSFRQLVPLPSVRTLQNVLSKMPISPGFNKNIMNHLSRKANELSCKDKTCVIMFDEMSLKKRLIYNSAYDNIEGYQDLGEHGRSGDLADKALVLLLQGVHKKFKQPLAYYFVKGTISSEKLVVIIKNAIKTVSEIGFKIIATICDQGPTNVGALNLLKKFTGQPSDSNFFLFDNNKVYIIYDVPHLLKSIRNNFFEAGEMIYDGKKAKWSHLVELKEKNKETLHFKKITALHVHPKFRAKMKVKLAAQIFSNDVAAILKLYAETFRQEQERDGTLKCNAILQTANIIEQLDKLFDVTNGPATKKDVKKGIRENVSRNSIHHKLWPKLKNQLKTMCFLKSDSQLRLKNVRCVNGFYISISSLQDIWNYVQSIGFKYLNLRQLNQDSLENLFGLIRQHSPTNHNPTCTHFTAALKTTILTKLSTPIRGANCEVDDNKLILDFHDLVFQNSEADDTMDAEHSYTSDVRIFHSSSYDESDPVLHLPDIEADIEESLFATFDKQPVVYVSGYLASRLIKNRNCHKCCDSLRTITPGNDKIYNYIALKEWWKDKLSLTYPTLDLCKTVDTCVSVFEREVRPYLHNNDIGKYSSLMMSKEINSSWLCEEHSKTLLDTLLCRLSVLLIRNDCRKINSSMNDEEQTNWDKNKIAQLMSSAK